MRVIDLTQGTSGPYCSFLLGAFGAEVIKVEPPVEGDPSRKWGPFPSDEPHPEKSAAFLYLNRNKRGITLDLNRDEGRRLFLELVEVGDAVVESYEPGLLDSKGLGSAILRQHNPAIIVSSVTDFGQTGPYSHFKGGELVLDAISGWAQVTGFAHREPLKPALQQAQYAAGVNAAIHTIAALNHRQSSGQGRNIDISVMETAVHFVGNSIGRYTHGVGIQVRAGNWTGLVRGSTAPFSHPTEIYECQDGHIGVAVQTAGQWEMFTVLVDIHELNEDPRFSLDYAERGRNADELNRLVAPWFMQRTRKEIFELFGEYRIPCGMVYSTAEIPQDPQHRDVGFFTDLEHPDAGTLPYPGSPFHGVDFPWSMQRAPCLGEHNSQVYDGLLGHAKEDLARLGAMGVI